MTEPTDIDVAVEKAKKALKKSRVPPLIKREDWLSSSSVLINLACSGTTYGAITKGRYFWMVGDSSSGKTFFTIGFLAEASIDKNFDDYDLVFDNAEDGALMDVRKFFGPKLEERLQPPSKTATGEPIYSVTAEDFFANVDARLTACEKGKGKPFIYLLDSMDSLTTDYEIKKFNEKMTEVRGGKKAVGDMGDGKAKMNSRWIRRMRARLRKTGSILIILSQTREVMNAGPFEPSTTHAGGRALKFYATWQLWSSIGKKKTKEVMGKQRQIGITCRIAVKKNRLTGKEWTVEVPIYWSHGIDDIGSMVDFMIEEGGWEGGSKINIPEFEFKGNRIQLIRHIEQNNFEFDLKQMVATAWKNIEAQCKVVRKNKYHQVESEVKPDVSPVTEERRIDSD